MDENKGSERRRRLAVSSTKLRGIAPAALSLIACDLQL